MKVRKIDKAGKKTVLVNAKGEKQKGDTDEEEEEPEEN